MEEERNLDPEGFDKQRDRVLQLRSARSQRTNLMFDQGRGSFKDSLKDLRD